MDERPGDERPDPPPMAEPVVEGAEELEPLTLSARVAEQLAAERDDLRARIDAGAATPEELQALLEQMRDVRERESQLWQQEVRPALVKAGKGEMRLGSRGDRAARAASGDRNLGVGAGIFVALVVLVVLATQSSVLWLLVPLVGVLAVAWWIGRRERRGTSGAAEGSDPTS